MLDGIKSYGKGMKGLGLTDAQIKSGDELAQSFKKMRGAISGTMNQIAAAVAPPVKIVVDALTSVIRVAGGIARDFPILTRIVAALGVALLVAGTALIVFGSIAAVVIPAVTALIGALDVAALPWILLGVAVAVVAVGLAAMAA